MAYTFDGASKRITLSTGTTVLSLIDLWSRYVDWLAINDNSKWLEAMRAVGRDTDEIPLYIFLLNGWRIVPQAADHVLSVTNGVLGVDGGGDPFVDPAGAYKIRIVYEKPGVAIGYSTSGGASGTPQEVAAAVRSELAVELGRIDRAISTIAAGSGMTLAQFLALKDV